MTNLRIIFNVYLGGMAHIIHKDLSYLINGILFEVHNEIGRFANEKQICDLIEMKLIEHKVDYKREFVLPNINQEEQVGRHRVDFLIDNKIVLEIKYRRYFTKDDYNQMLRYLTTLNLALGILVNFRDSRLHPHRIINGGGKE